MFPLDLQQWGTNLYQLVSSKSLRRRSNASLALLVNSTGSLFWSVYNVCESRAEHDEVCVRVCVALILMMFHQSVWSLSSCLFLAVCHSCLFCKKKPNLSVQWLTAIFCCPPCPWTFPTNVNKSEQTAFHCDTGDYKGSECIIRLSYRLRGSFDDTTFRRQVKLKNMM